MILADTSVWIDHFRRSNPKFADALGRGGVIMHPAVLGELACGNLVDRRQTLADLSHLRMATQARHREVRALIESHQLFGRGIGYLDAHLLASARLDGIRLLTRDKRLAAVAEQLGVAAVLN